MSDCLSLALAMGSKSFGSVEHSSCANPRVAIVCRFSGGSSRCDPWSLIVVSDLIREHPHLPSFTLAVSAHLHKHGREGPGLRDELLSGRQGGWSN